MLSENVYPIKQPAKLGKVIDSNGSDIGFQISQGGGEINLSSGHTDDNGFYIAVAGDQGLVNVKLFNDNTYTLLPFFTGWNPVLVKSVSNSGNTATQVYWGR